MKWPTSIRRSSILLAFGMPLLSTATFAQSPLFSVKALENFPGTTRTSVVGINNNGEVVGGVFGTSVCLDGCAAIWSEGTPILLGTVNGATGSLAISVNNAGQIVGNVYMTEVSPPQAVIWNNGAPTLLPPPGAQYTQTFASFVNDAGQVVGQAEGQVGTVQELDAIMWNGSSPTVLGVVPGHTLGQAEGINSNGLIVGELSGDGQAPQAVVWHGTTATVLPRLTPIQGASGKALAVNNSGVVVGYATSTTTPQHAVAWANGVVTDLGALATGIRSAALAVNNRGIIVGQSYTAKQGQNAVIWNRIGAKPQDLNTLISAKAAAEINLSKATGINDNCTITATGYARKTNEAEAVVLVLSDPSKCVNGGF